MSLFDQLSILIADKITCFIVIAKFQTVSVGVRFVFRFVRNEGFDHRDGSWIEGAFRAADLPDHGIDFRNRNQKLVL